MKKQLITLLLVLGLGISAKGMDPFYVKNHGSETLNDHQWHMLTYESSFVNNYKPIYVRDIEIRQKDNGVDYEFRSLSSDEAANFKDWLIYYKEHCDDWKNNTEISLESKPDKNKYFIGVYHNGKFVPDVDDFNLFVGIDVFK